MTVLLSIMSVSTAAPDSALRCSVTVGGRTRSRQLSMAAALPVPAGARAHGGTLEAAPLLADEVRVADSVRWPPLPDSPLWELNTADGDPRTARQLREKSTEFKIRIAKPN